jgi:capsule polysaccharide export protein KpsE/RkpR
VNYSIDAPARQLLPQVPESDFPSSTLQPEPPESNEKVLMSFRLMWGHRRMLYRVSLYGLLAGTLVAFLIPTRYESTARLMPPDNQSSSGMALAAAAMSGTSSGGLGALAGDFLGLKSTSDVFVGILSSRTVQDTLIQQFDLKKLYRTRSMVATRRALAEHTGIAVDRKSQIITITVTDASPQCGAAIAQAYVVELNRLVTELSTSAARRERMFLEGRLQTVSKDLEEAEKDFSQFASKNTAIDVKEQAKAMMAAAATLQGQLIAAQSQYQGLREIYTDSNIRVKTVKTRIDELQRQLDKLGGKNESSTEASSESGASLYPSIRKLPLLGVTYADLYRRTRVQEAVFETLTKEYELAKVQEAKEIPTVKVLDAPDIPDRKSFPPRLLIMFTGTICAFACAALWLVARNTWEETGVNDTRKVFAREVLNDFKAQLPKFVQNGLSNYAGGMKAPLPEWRRERRDR